MVDLVVFVEFVMGFCWLVVAGGELWWLAVGLGGWQWWVCFTLLQTHNVEYFPEHFSECKQTLEKQIFSCKSFAFANILRQKMFYVETNGALIEN